jgi:argininosuccinate lyase
VLDPARIVASRQAVGGAAPEAVEAMLQTTFRDAASVAAEAAARLEDFAAAEDGLLAHARAFVERAPDRAPTEHTPTHGGTP